VTEQDVASVPGYTHVDTTADPLASAQNPYQFAGPEVPMKLSDAERLQYVGRNILAGPESIPDGLKDLQQNEGNYELLESVHKRLRGTAGDTEKLDPCN